MLTPQNPVCIDLIEQTPIYCKIDTSNRVPPVKIFIEFKDAPSLTAKVRGKITKTEETDLFKPDWKIYASDKFFEPSEVNCQYAFTNLSRFTIEPKGAGIFKKREQYTEFLSDNLFFNFLSLKGCSVRVSIKFPREDEENDKNKKAKLSKGSQLKKIQLQFREEI